jgi:hypothetical protein
MILVFLGQCGRGYEPRLTEYSIQDVIQMQGYRLPKGYVTYPVTLIWYPRDVEVDPDWWSISNLHWAHSDDTIVPKPGMEEEWLRELRAEDDAIPKDTTPNPDDPLEEIKEILASASKDKEKAHKRTISEVIPRKERKVEREGAAQDNAQANGDSEVNEIAQTDKNNAHLAVRRSGRALKPIKRR